MVKAESQRRKNENPPVHPGHRVWIELEIATGPDAKNIMQERAKLASVMIRKLAHPESTGTFDHFFVIEEKSGPLRYAIQMDTSGMYQVCNDNGHWFNLAYFGKEHV